MEEVLLFVLSTNMSNRGDIHLSLKHLYRSIGSPSGPGDFPPFILSRASEMSFFVTGELSSTLASSQSEGILL